MEDALRPFDYHDYKIGEQRTKLLNLATNWLSKKEISTHDFAEISRLLEQNDVDLWRPLLYVIPRTSILLPRIEHVPPADRANTGMEYRIADLKNDEFDVVAFEIRT